VDAVAFFLDNSALQQVDFSRPLDGNPGAGATEFMTVLVASELSKKSVDVTLLTTATGLFPSELKVKKVKDIHEAILYSATNQKILTIRAYLSDFEKILERIKAYRELDVLIWAHLTPNQSSLKSIAKIPQIKAVICLENNQRVRMGDSLAHRKLLTIPYGITGNTQLVSVSKNPNTIVFVGALVPQKGFHLLADAWPKIEKAIPDAKLYVFGSGRLYDSRIDLGPNEIATKDYENRIFRKLNKDSHNVEFLGNGDPVLRNSILDKCKLGIVNPSAQTETFCLSAVEFEQRGIPVVGGRKYGLLDTVKHKKTGYLVSNPSNLHKHIVRLLRNTSRIETLGHEAQRFVFEKFSLSTVIDRWYNVFEAFSEGSTVAVARETKQMRIRSAQALFVFVNRPFVVLTQGHWPSGVSVWEAVKKSGRPLSNYRRRLMK
jgi:glycosyltransferase involved in cell wall biosynthesis